MLLAPSSRLAFFPTSQIEPPIDRSIDRSTNQAIQLKSVACCCCVLIRHRLTAPSSGFLRSRHFLSPLSRRLGPFVVVPAEPPTTPPQARQPIACRSVHRADCQIDRSLGRGPRGSRWGRCITRPLRPRNSRRREAPASSVPPILDSSYTHTHPHPHTERRQPGALLTMSTAAMDVDAPDAGG